MANRVVTEDDKEAFKEASQIYCDDVLKEIFYRNGFNKLNKIIFNKACEVLSDIDYQQRVSYLKYRLRGFDCVREEFCKRLKCDCNDEYCLMFTYRNIKKIFIETKYKVKELTNLPKDLIDIVGEYIL